jgi:uncharacterized GH25 family protein
LEAFEKIAYVTAMDYEYQRWAREAITAIKAVLEAKDEIVEWKMGASGIGGTGVIVQPQRTWVGLTDEEIAECFKITPDQYLPWQIYKRIEAKLRSKNENR